MTDSLVTGLVSVALAIVGVATVATLVSNKAQTAQVLQAGGNAFGTDLLAAVSPVTGTAPQITSQLA
jgi:hypothetical protein